MSKAIERRSDKISFTKNIETFSAKKKIVSGMCRHDLLVIVIEICSHSQIV
jgi:hypothetical protein